MSSAVRLFGLVVLWGAPAQALEPVPPELRALRKSLERTQQLSARFKQTRHWAALQDAMVTEGSIRYEKKGQLVWHMDPPSESEIILDDQRVTIHYLALGTTQILDFATDPGLGKVFQSIRSVLEADLERLEPIFELRIVRKTPLMLTLKPRLPEVARTVERIQLEFDKELRLTQVRLDEPGGDWTEIIFHSHVIKTATQ